MWIGFSRLLIMTAHAWGVQHIVHLVNNEWIEIAGILCKYDD